MSNPNQNHVIVAPQAFHANTPTNNSPLAKVSPSERNENSIQVALLLDTSGSMDGLIDQARAQLWSILNELATFHNKEVSPTLEVALYEYGSSKSSSDNLQINQLAPFTTDMDYISEALFSLYTDGGNEYCGAVIKTSLDNLDWSDKGGLQMIYIAGNESFNQGPINYEPQINRAKENGIVVNTIFCNDGRILDGELWARGAKQGNGSHFVINHNEAIAHIETPYDDEIIKLNGELNETYYAYDEAGESKKSNLLLQDQNASKLSPETLVDRINFKAGKQYKNDSWDLVTSYNNDNRLFDKVKLKNTEFEGLSKKELKLKVKEIEAKRELISVKVGDLESKRIAFKKKHSAKGKKDNLGESIISSVKKQAKDKGYDVKE